MSKELNAIKKEIQPEITRIYELYRDDFIGYAIKNFGLDSDDIAEIYHESFIDLFRNIKSERLTNLSSGLKTYLFQIGKHKIMNLLRSKGRTGHKNFDENSYYKDSLEDDSHFENDTDLKQEIVNLTVSEMAEPCNTVLHLYYWKRKSMGDIASILGYKSAQVAKNRKSLCMKRLKKILIEKFRLNGLY